MKKLNIFCYSFQKVKPIYYTDSLHRVKYFKPLFLEMLMIVLQIMKTQNSESQKIRILHKINKKDILKRNARLLKSMYISMHSILGWAFLLHELLHQCGSGMDATIMHSNTMVIEPAFGTFGSVGRCQVQLENEISISIMLVSRRTHGVL